jgi:acyl-CoA dehydrogenase
MSASGPDSGLLDQTLARLFTERCGPEARQAAEVEGWAGECWDALDDAGLLWVGVPEAAGGSGGDIEDACTLVRAAGRHAVPLPLAEGALLGGWLLALAGLQLPGGPVTVAAPRSADTLALRDGRVTGRLDRVPWGARAAGVVGLAHSPDGVRVVLLDPGAAQVRLGHNVAGEPRDALTWDEVDLPSERVGAPPFDPTAELAVRGALSRALLMAGAMESIADLTVDYAGQRQQFGRPIASFQAVAQRLVRLSAEAEAGMLATEVAAGRFASLGMEADFEVAVAKVSAARAAGEVAAHAHQVHGAIGMTREYSLHHFTRRLWSWRQEWGSERRWARVVGERAVAAGADALWPRVATGLVAAP